MILPSTAKKSRHGPSGKISMEPLIQQRTSRAADDDALFSISSSASTKQHKLKKGSLVMLSNVKGGKRSKQRKDCVSLDGGSVHSTASFASKMSVQSAPMVTGPIKIEGSATKRRKSKQTKRAHTRDKTSKNKNKKQSRTKTDPTCSKSRPLKPKRHSSEAQNISMEDTAPHEASRVRFQGGPPRKIPPSAIRKKKSSDWTRYWYTQEEIDHFRHVHLDTAIQRNKLLDHNRVPLTARFSVNDVYQVCRFVPQAKMPKLTTSQKSDLVKFYRAANGETVGLEYQFLTQGQVRSQRRQALYKVVVHDSTYKNADELRRKSCVISHQSRFFAAHVGMAQSAAALVSENRGMDDQGNKPGTSRSKTSRGN